MRKILIVDDNPDDIEITRVVLEEKGWDLQVEAYRQAEQGLARLRESEDLPSLVLLDINIPGMGGIECLRQIRADQRLKSIPVVMVPPLPSRRMRKRPMRPVRTFFCSRTSISTGSARTWIPH